MTTERLQKILAHAGHGSRRACEIMIEEGRVTVDGQIAQLGDKADPDTQRIMVDDVPIRVPKTHTYIALYKPRGVISTTSDPEGRRTVIDLIPLEQRLYPVGRLDADSEGLILLTDDGAVTERLTHPRYGHARVYRVLVGKIPTTDTLERWQNGITLDGKKTQFSRVEIESQEHGQTWLRVTVHEGRKHLVRRVITALGHPVLRLIRVEMGPVHLGDLRPGRWRYLTQGELKAISRQTGVATARKMVSSPKRESKYSRDVRARQNRRNRAQDGSQRGGDRDGQRRRSSTRSSGRRSR
ncbi:MAG: rRNA pseudouridine synthase [Anaerolineae bacterium]|nr:rRNA pseudouridine synthase [Anaerolineae bacterium]